VLSSPYPKQPQTALSWNESDDLDTPSNRRSPLDPPQCLVRAEHEILIFLYFKNRYLGLKFTIKGTTHFGWARLNVTCTTMYGNHKVTGVLTGYAYETIPNKPIITGKTGGPGDDDQPAPASLKTHTSEPTTLGALALAAPGLAIWRREEPAA
jgi:hypothetical protein